MNNKYVKKIILNVKKYFLNNKLFLSYLLLSVLIGILLHIITLGFSISPRAIYSDLLFAIFFGTFGYLFKSKNRYTYYLVLLIIYSGLAIGNTIYYQFYHSFISISLLSTASMLGKVSDSLLAKIKLIQFVYIIFPIIFICIQKKLIKNNYYDHININVSKKSFKKVIYSFIFLIISLLCIVSINDVSKLNSQYNRPYIVRKYGLYLYSINDLIQGVKVNDNLSYEKAATKYKEFYSCKWKNKKKPNEYTNKFKGKNIIFIHAESIQNFLIDLKINDREVIPNINKFAKEGIYFSKFYPQISVGTSSDTEFSLLTGLMPSAKGTVFVNYFDRTYKAMPQYFNKLGYYTFSMHGNDRDYWNRAVMHERLGYDKFYGKESYDVNEDNIVGLGISDSAFFEQSIDKLKEIKKNHNSYFGTMITLSNHSPFSDLDAYPEFDVSLEYKYKNKHGNTKTVQRDYLENTVMGNYIKSAHYADMAFGEFIDSLKKENLLENTIIVFYGDHEARLPEKDFDLLYNYDPVNDNILNKNDANYISMDNYNYDLLKNTPLIIWSNEEKLSTRVESTMGMYDILPTIANMFGFKEKYSLGNDIFSDNEKIVVFPNGNILTDKVYYSELYEEYITFTKEPISIDYINRITKYAEDILDVSNGIVNFDLIEKERDNVGKCNEKK